MQYIFNIDNNKECLISKDPVTMKTGVMAAENTALPSINYILKYSSQYLKWIKKVHQSCPKTRTHFGFRF